MMLEKFDFFMFWLIPTSISIIYVKRIRLSLFSHTGICPYSKQVSFPKVTQKILILSKLTTVYHKSRKILFIILTKVIIRI